MPTSFGYDAPFFWHTVPERERKTRCLLNADYCVIDENNYFIRGCLEIPVIGRNEPFVWGVWASLSKSNFERAGALTDVATRTEEPAYFGWLSNRVQIYPDTIHLKTHLHTRSVGTRPLIELESTNHPLSLEQRTGITIERVKDIAEKIAHGWEHPDWISKQV